MKRDHIYHHLEELRKEGIAKKALDKWCPMDDLKEIVLAFQKGWRAAEAHLSWERTEEQILKDRIAENPQYFIVEREGKFRLKKPEEHLHEMREIAHSRRDAQMDKGFMRDDRMTSEKTMRFCNNCGAEIDARAIICPKCKKDIPKEKLKRSFMFGSVA